MKVLSKSLVLKIALVPLLATIMGILVVLLFYFFAPSFNHTSIPVDQIRNTKLLNEKRTVQHPTQEVQSFFHSYLVFFMD